MKFGRDRGLPKPTAFDYVVMIGGPLVCLIVLWVGMSKLMGKPPPVSAVAKLHDGAIAEGATEKQATDELGQPDAKVVDPAGGFTYRYSRSVYRGDAKELAEEDAIVAFSDSGVVSGVTYDVHTVKASEPAKQ